MDNIGFGLLLMIVGMTTVFLILLTVIFLGRLLIAVVNRIAPEEANVKKSASTSSKTIVDNNTMAAIKAAVNIVTAGKSKVVKVEKI